MTNPPPPKSQPLTPTGPFVAGPAAPGPTMGEPKGAARKGVLSALRPDPHAVVITGIQPGFQVHMTGVPVADWLCVCGHHERARGRAAVIELAARVRIATCPHATAEGRSAA